MNRNPFTSHSVLAIVLILVLGGILPGCLSIPVGGQVSGTRGDIPTAIIDSIDPSPALYDQTSLLDQFTIGYWSFDSATDPGHDDSLNGNTGALIGGSVVDGYSGKAIQLDGSDDYMELSESFPDTDELTVAAWVYHTGGEDYSTILMDATTDLHNDFVFNMNDTQIGIRADKNGAELNREEPPGAQGDLVLDLGTGWRHLTWLMISTTSILYVNGSYIGRVEETGSNVGYHNPTPCIGRWFDGGGSREYFSGMIDELGIWSRALNAAEIQSVMNGELGRVVTFTADGTDDGTITQYAWSSDIDGEFYNGTLSSFKYTGLSMGNHTITLRVMDDEGQWSEPVTINHRVMERPLSVIDDIDPDRAIEYDPVRFDGSGISPGNIVVYEWSSDLSGLFYSGPDASHTYADLGPGQHYISLRVQDDLGLWSEPVYKLLIIDPEFPIIEEFGYIWISSPQTGTTVSGGINITGSAEGAYGPIYSIEVQVNNGACLNCTVIGTTGWYYRLDTRDLPEGNHTIQAWAMDSFGTEIGSNKVVIIIAGEANERDDGNVLALACLSGLLILLLLVLLGLSFNLIDYRNVLGDNNPLMKPMAVTTAPVKDENAEHQGGEDRSGYDHPDDTTSDEGQETTDGTKDPD